MISVYQAAKEGRQVWHRRPRGLRGIAYQRNPRNHRKPIRPGLDDFDQVQRFMQGAKTQAGWDDKVSQVARANGGCLPDWWREAIIDSGIEEIVKARFGLHPQEEPDHQD